jgi:endonuclease/exonuclease/phosphatase family metal-dependent hydrolase
MRLRAVTYNVHGFRAGVDRVAAVLSPIGPDVVCLQECGSRRRLRRLCAALRMEAVSSHRPFRRVRNAVLYGMPFRVTDCVVQELSREGRTARRGFVSVTLEAYGASVVAMSLHLGLTASERRRHAAEVLDALSGSRRPTVVGADLNEEPVGPSVRGFVNRFVDTYAAVGHPPGNTFPAAAATDRIDVLLVRGDCSVRRAWVPSDAAALIASDHLPAVADLELGT